jgi:hypothetical protein
MGSSEIRHSTFMPRGDSLFGIRVENESHWQAQVNSIYPACRIFLLVQTAKDLK